MSGIHANVEWCLYFARRYDEAIAEFKEGESSAGVKDRSAALLAHAHAVTG